MTPAARTVRKDGTRAAAELNPSAWPQIDA